MIFSCYFLKVTAQQVDADRLASLPPLTIGDSIPEVVWQMPLRVANHPEGKDTISLANYREKTLIILDFWATWCKPCIKSVIKIDSLIKELGSEEVAFLPVQVYDLVPNAYKFLQKHQWELPTIVGDTVLNKRAFYNYLTGFGVVWIADGKLLAVPQPKDITFTNLTKALSREQLNIEHRKGYPLLEK